MSCAKFRERLGALASGELPPRLAGPVREHLAGCPGCARVHRETVATLALLRGLDDEGLPPGFEASLHRRLMAEPPRRAGALRRWLADVASAIAERPRTLATGALGVGVAFAGLLWLALPHAPTGTAGSTTPNVALGEVAPVFVVPRAKVAVVRIDFQAEEAVEGVEFAIRLPEGLHFVSEGRELPDREFRWQGRLERGSNPIPVAVRGGRAGRYTLTAHAVAPTVETRHEVVLEVRS